MEGPGFQPPSLWGAVSMHRGCRVRACERPHFLAASLLPSPGLGGPQHLDLRDIIDSLLIFTTACQGPRKPVFLMLNLLQEGGLFQGLRVGSCLMLRNELSEVIHVLKKHKT